MGELWRSEEMQLIQLFVQIDAARDTVDELGKLGLIQFRDLNPEVSPFQRNFVNEVKRCDEMERRIRFFEDLYKKDKAELQELREKGLLTHEDAVVKLDSDTDAKDPTFDELEVRFEELEKELTQMNQHQESLDKNYNELVQLRHVLQKDASFFDETVEFDKEDDHDTKPLVDKESAVSKNVKLGFITGVIPREKFRAFEKVMWRVLRGNLYMKHAEIEEKLKDPHSLELIDKNVFIIFYQGERSYLKIKKICESFNTDLYTIPETARERKELLTQVGGRIDDLKIVLEKTKKHRRSIIYDIARRLTAWREMIIKEKAIYHAMNEFNYDVGRKLLIAEGWCPKFATEKIVNALRVATERSGAQVPSVMSVVQTHEEPPTYFKTNKFTSSFQAIVEAYGVAQYQEVNPAVLTIITFPFLFGVMFGDFGHGMLMTAFASFLIYKEKAFLGKPLNEMIKTCFDGRYVLLPMGLFSMYVGLLYNECFSIPIDLCKTNWSYPDCANCTTVVAVRKDPHRTYEFGVDPAWKGSANNLNYYNSLKMKMSVIFGVTQMSVGIFLSLLNGLHFHSKVNIFCEFLPQILFLLCIFGYMCFLIFFKWASVWTTTPPFLLNVMIQMFLHPYGVAEENLLFQGQEIVQAVLLGVAVVCIPWMLLTKPYILKYQHKKRMAAKASGKAVPEESHGHGHGHGEGGEFDFGEIFVKQIIHTIEFVLGAISNTASYLRLWALSLAHAELSEVFWERVLLLTYSVGGFYAIFIGFAIWAGMTFAVLMVMESLSAFLHALRLHWVEFQNKFYHGDGYKFEPFSYVRVLKGESDDN